MVPDVSAGTGLLYSAHKENGAARDELQRLVVGGGSGRHDPTVYSKIKRQSFAHRRGRRGISAALLGGGVAHALAYADQRFRLKAIECVHIEISQDMELHGGEAVRIAQHRRRNRALAGGTLKGGKGLACGTTHQRSKVTVQMYLRV